MSTFRGGSKLMTLLSVFLYDFLLLIGSMVNDQNADLIIGTLGFSHYDTIPPVNHCCGIGVNGIYPIYIEVSILAKENRVIHCHIKDIAKNKECILMTVYAPAQERDKDHLATSQTT